MPTESIVSPPSSFHEGAPAIHEALRIIELRQALPAPKERREIRRRCGLTLTAVAADIGVAPASVARWETGEREPQPRHVEAYAKALELMTRIGDEAGAAA